MITEIIREKQKKKSLEAELADVNVEIYFSAGEVVKRVRELLGK